MTATTNTSELTSSAEDLLPFAPAAYFDVRSIEQLKAFTDPLRVRILGVLARRVASNKQLAEVLEQPQPRVFHHLKTLLDLGLVRLVDTEIKGGNVEKYYRSIAHQFMLHTGPEFDPQSEDYDAALRGQFNGAIAAKIRDEIDRSAVRWPLHPPTIYRRRANLDHARTKEFDRKLRELLEEYWPMGGTTEVGTMWFAGFLYRDEDYEEAE